MGTTATAQATRTLQRRRIIQRSRLLAILDESKARIRTLIAAAGYGKTTLAEQWVATGGKRWAWYTVRHSAVDVAALALGIARSCTAIVPDCDERLRAHLKAVSAPAGSSRVLAEILCEDLADWPSDAWLVIDDYQEIAGSEEAESFVGDLVGGCPVQVVLTSRQRPAWVTARSILYGEVLEVPQASLAMDRREAGEVLSGWSGQAASGLVALANGWPAVIGLAGVSAAEIRGEGDFTVPESLYRFFAEEVFAALGDEVRAGLTLLSLAPVLDRELAVKLLGEDGVGAVCDVALDTGILVERDTRLELHPLARSFLEEQSSAAASRSAISICLSYYRETRDWDAAFDLIVRHNTPDELPGLLEAALDDLLDAARLSTIHEWCDYAADRRVRSPVVALARAEAALRESRHAAAQAYAEAAATHPGIAFRALSVAGRAAHLASREEVARTAYERAYASASNDAERRMALWGRLLCEIELELPEAEKTYAALARDATTSDPNDFVRAAISNLSCQLRFGHLRLAELEAAHALLDEVDDPLISSSFLSGYSHALALATRYDEALEASNALRDITENYHFQFAVPFVHLPAASAHAGKREWDLAEQHIREARETARRVGDEYGDQSGYSILVRVLTQQGRYAEALAEPVPDVSVAVPSQRGEVLASRALALAAAGHPEDALALISRVPGSTAAVEPTMLVAATRAIASVRGAAKRDIGTLDQLVASASATGAPDLLVAAYRSSPELLRILLQMPETTEAVRSIVVKIGDDDLAQHHGLLLPESSDPNVLLTAREREIYELLLQGLSNRQIAELLFIEISTVKAHTHHIYEKLGVHSRTALAIQASLARRN